MNMESATASPPKGIWGIIGDVFFSPAQAFAAYKENPSPWIPLVLVMVMAAAAGYFTAPEAAMDQYQMMKHSTTLPPQAIEQMRQDAENPGRIGASLGPAIMVPLVGMLTALLAWFFGGFIFGGKAKFMEIWGAGLMATLIPMVGGLIRIPMAIAKGTAQVSIGPAALVPQSADYISILGFIFFFTDVFAIWSLIVLCFGYSEIFGISRGKGAATAVLVWVIMTSLVIGMMLFGLSFAGVDMRFI